MKAGNQTSAPSIEQRIANELSVNVIQVAAAVGLLDGGATVPFISRYRKEATGGLSDTQLRSLHERLGYLRELEDRRSSILKSIQEQGKLTPALAASIGAADTKATLEDLYLPYKQKRRTKALIAREAGLEPLADALFSNPTLNPTEEAAKYCNVEKGVPDPQAALDGARQILMERWSEHAGLLAELRGYLQNHGVLQSKVIEGKESEGAKFSDYFSSSELLKNVPSHRALAQLRGQREGILNVSIEVPVEDTGTSASGGGASRCEQIVARSVGFQPQGRAADQWLQETVRWTWRVKLSLTLTLELMGALRERSEADAITVFAKNLKDLLLLAPAGPRTTLGLDPGIRTGVKVAVVDPTGKVLDTTTIYPHAPRNDWKGSIVTLAALIAKHKVELIAIGNGTASRETDSLVADLMKEFPAMRVTKVSVSEAGASVYSASELASRELPSLDVSIRGAVSIARRLQDPLAELVKIDPKSIGVGQYQHDVSESQLARALSAVVEDCVNGVGVDLNTASPALLARISGLNTGLAEAIVAYRDSNGAFRSRKDLLKVPRLGDRTFEQAAGFLRISNGESPLDASSVHPESYPLVERILVDLGRGIREVIGDVTALRKLSPEKYADERFGIPTVTDIIKELEKPGRDPRPEFRTATFNEGVKEISDLHVGALHEGVVTNVTSFGAFIDIGVHQDGLVHISALSEKFVKDPREVVKAGDIVKVRVVEVDIPRKRIGLSMRINDPLPSAQKATPASGSTPTPRTAAKPTGSRQPQNHSSSEPPAPSLMALALQKMKEKAANQKS
jgi:uncharacterized protein